MEGSSMLLRLMLVILAATAVSSHPAASKLVSMTTKIPFRPDGTFTITQFADIHYSTGDLKVCRDVTLGELPCSDLNTTAFIGRVLDRLTPDLAVFTGDNIQGTLNADRAVRAYSQPAVDRKVPWAMVFGNHDEDGNLSREQMMDIVLSLPYHVSERGPSDVQGVGNYLIQLVNGDTNPFNLYFLDSGAYSKIQGVSGYDWIKPSQINWFLEISKSLKEQNSQTVPALAFFHIPIPEYEKATNKVGDEQEGVFDAEINSGFFSAILESGDVQATFVGHDHVNDYCGTHFGVNLCYGGGIGYGTYGKEGWKRRSRIIRIENFGATIRTWKVLDDATLTVVNEQILNQGNSGKVGQPK